MIQVFINNEEVVCDKNFTISEEILATSSTILNNCYPKSWETDKDYISKFYYPQDYSKCKILKNNELIFCGVVKNSGEISLNPRYPHFCSLQILDFKTFLSEGETLDFVINNKTVSQAIYMVVEAIKDYGFKVGNINMFGADDIIGAYSTLNKTAYDVLQYLAEITGSRWYTRLIDESTIAIDFYDPTLMPKADNLQYTVDYFESNNIKDITFSYGTRDYRNKQVILSDEVYGSVDYIETILADGYNRAFNTQNNIGIIKTITVDGVEKTFATDEEKNIGIYADFYYKAGENKFESNSDESPYVANSSIVITYTPLVKGRQTVFDDDEINRITSQTGRKGVITRYETRNDVLNSDELNKIGQTYIKYKGSPEVILKVSTLNKDIYNIGQVVYFDAPIDELKQDYMVKKKSTQVISTGDYNNIFYEYELTSSFNSENAINYFDNQRNKSTGNISTGNFITRNIDIENEILIEYNNLTIQEIEAVGDNTLNSTLDSPFIS